MVYVGSLILQALENSPEERLPLIEIAKYLRNNGVNKSRPMTFALMLLYLAEVIEFKAPYIYRVTR